MSGPHMIRTEDQMVGLSIVMRLATFRKLKVAAGDDMRAWSDYIARLIEQADRR